MVAGMSSCNRDSGRDDPAIKGPVDVRVLVSNAGSTRSVGSDATDNAIRQLRVYAFNEKGERVGYNDAADLTNQTYIPMTLTEGGNLYFYVVANDHFGMDPKVGAESVSDWSLLTQSDLQTLTFTGWQGVNGEYISPMSNNRYKENGNLVELEYKNDYASPVSVTSHNQLIPVTVQHVLGRLRLLLNTKADLNDSYVVTLTRAAVYHRPDAIRLYNGGSDPLTYDHNAETLVDEFVTSDISLTKKPADGYTEVGRTFLAPNIYGSGDMIGTAPAQHDDKAYRLDLTVSFAYKGGAPLEKTYIVYLPPVSRNESIDVQGTFDATAVELKFNVMTNAWVEKEITIPPFS